MRNFLAALFLAIFSTGLADCQPIRPTPGETAVVIPPGSERAPGLYVFGDRRTGFFSPGPGQMIFISRGVPGLDFSAVRLSGPGKFMESIDPNYAVEGSGAVWAGSNLLSFEGTAADDFEITIGVVGSPTTDTLYILSDLTADFGYLMSSPVGTATFGIQTTLATNAPGVANSIWVDTQQVYWEGANEDSFETRLGAVEATAITRVWLGDYNSTGVGGNVWLPVSTGAAQAVVPGKANAIWFGNNEIEFEGSNEDTIETRLKARNATGSDKEIWLPNTAGDVAVIEATDKTLQLGSVVFGSLPSASDGTILLCSDCSIGASCSGSGSGALAIRLAGGWVCN